MTNTRLIQSRSGAFFAVAFTGWLAYLATRAALRQQAPHSFHLFPRLPFLPVWALFALDVFNYVFIVWVCIASFREASEKERFIVACCLVTFLLWPIQPFVTPGLAVSLQYAKGLALSAAFLMSVLIALGFFVPAMRDRTE